jgi:hypothetical protein
MAPLMRRRAMRRGGGPPPGFGGPPPMIRLLVQVVDDLVKDYPDDDALREAVRRQVRNSEAMAVTMFHNAARGLPEPPPADAEINPYNLGLDSTSWDVDGLFESPGLTVEDAGKVLAGGPAAAPVR